VIFSFYLTALLLWRLLEVRLGLMKVTEGGLVRSSEEAGFAVAQGEAR